MSKLNERIRAVAFDLDGTLIDTMGDLAASVNMMLGMLGAKELPESRVRALVGNGVETLVLRALNESVGSSATHAAQRSAAHRTRWLFPVARSGSLAAQHFPAR